MAVDPCDGLLGNPRPFRIQAAPAAPQNIGGANPRKRFVIFVLTVGATVWIGPGSAVAVGKGIPIPNINGPVAYFIDEYPYAHKGEWYAISDNANTDIVVCEVT